MKSTPDLPADPLGTLGAPIRPAAPAKPDPVREFERIGDSNKAMQTIADARKPRPVVTDGDASEWEGACFSPLLTDEELEALAGCLSCI